MTDRILGIDYGTRRIGCAIGDLETRMAFGLPVVDAAGDPVKDAVLISELADRQEASSVVVGMPLTLGGEMGRSANLVQTFIDRLRLLIHPRPVDTWDERYTSVDAEDRLHRDGIKLTKKRKRRHLNTMAAQTILQEYIDSRGRS